MPSAEPQAFAFLSRRRSHTAKLFKPPAPGREELMTILSAATRVPDHGKLEPWRLVVIERPAMARLADMAEARGQELGVDDAQIAKGRGQYDRGVLAVAVISSPKSLDRIPLVEQRASAAALCFGILNAAESRGWGANWLTGWPAHDPVFATRAFGCTGEEIVMGIVHIATAPSDEAPDRPRPDLAGIVSYLD